MVIAFRSAVHLFGPFTTGVPIVFSYSSSLSNILYFLHEVIIPLCHDLLEFRTWDYHIPLV